MSTENNMPKLRLGSAIGVGSAFGILCYCLFNHGESAKYNELAIWLAIGCAVGALFEWLWISALRSIYKTK